MIKLLSCLQYCRLLSFVRIAAMKAKYEHRTKSRSQRNNKDGYSVVALCLHFKIILCPLQTFLVLFSVYNAFKSAVRFDSDFIMTKANIKKLKLYFYAKINF